MLPEVSMINPIKHIKAVYKANSSVRKIQEIGYTEGYFMKKSPLAKDSFETVNNEKKSILNNIKTLFNINK